MHHAAEERARSCIWTRSRLRRHTTCAKILMNYYRGETSMLRAVECWKDVLRDTAVDIMKHDERLLRQTLQRCIHAFLIDDDSFFGAASSRSEHRA